jgi:hypothetical protein
VYNELRETIATLVLEKVTLTFIENYVKTFEQKDHLIKSLIVALGFNESSRVR